MGIRKLKCLASQFFPLFRSLKEMFLGKEQDTVERVVPTYTVPDFVPDPQFTR